MNDYESLIFLFKERSKLLIYLTDIEKEIESLYNSKLFYEEFNQYVSRYDNDSYKKPYGKLSKAEYLKNLETKNIKNAKKIHKPKEYSKAKTSDIMTKKYHKSPI
jgi:hypothetical protein